MSRVVFRRANGEVTEIPWQVLVAIGLPVLGVVFLWFLGSNKKFADTVTNGFSVLLNAILSPVWTMKHTIAEAAALALRGGASLISDATGAPHTPDELSTEVPAPYVGQDEITQRNFTEAWNRAVAAERQVFGEDFDRAQRLRVIISPAKAIMYRQWPTLSPEWRAMEGRLKEIRNRLDTEARAEDLRAFRDAERN